jgi:2-oxoglutarate ferredoxin oxidoreductase subunit beta
MIGLALQLGATFVARSFSGDKTQLVPLIKAAIAHRGAAFLDVVSPCVAFNNHPGSTKSYDYVRAHNEAVNRIDFIAHKQEITVDYSEGQLVEVEQHDGSMLVLKKLHREYDPHDRISAMNYVAEHQARGQVVTGLLYLDAEAQDLHEHLKTVEASLNSLTARELSPGAAVLEKINAALR